MKKSNIMFWGWHISIQLCLIFAAFLAWDANETKKMILFIVLIALITYIIIDKSIEK